MLRRKCVIGKYARIAFDSQFMDSDFHYMLNIEDGTVKNCTSFIEIGAYNWIGNRTTVKKGTVTPDYTIVAAPQCDAFQGLYEDMLAVSDTCGMSCEADCLGISSGFQYSD